MFETAQKKCCVCYNPELDELIYQSKEKLEDLSEQKVKSLFYGFSCDKKAEDKIKILNNYIKVLEDENRRIVLGGEPCLNCDNLQRLAEKVRVLVISCDLEMRRDLTVDNSNFDAWVAQNPTCVAYETWERLAYRVCGLLNIEVKILEEITCDVDFKVFTEEQVCNLAFEVSRSIIPCDVMVALSVHRQACDLNFKINRTEEECKIDFKILSTEVECDLDYKMYRRLIECNLSYDIIRTVYENDCTFNVGDPVQLVTPLNTYDIDKFNFTDLPNIAELSKLGIDVSESEYAKNPSAFIEKLKSDYHSK